MCYFEIMEIIVTILKLICIWFRNLERKKNRHALRANVREYAPE